MNIKPIRTDTNYRATLTEVEALMMAELNTPEGEKLDVLVTQVEAYEHKQFPLDLSDPVGSHQICNGAERINDKRPGTDDWKK